MDDYKEFFYKMVPSAQNVDRGDLTDRKKLRKDLHCKSFRWYLENIYPEAPIPYDYISLGAIKNLGTNNCIDTKGNKKSGNPGLITCHNLGGNQLWSFCERGKLANDDSCLVHPSIINFDKQVKIDRCTVSKIPNDNEVFKYNKELKLIVHVKTGDCLKADNEKIIFAPCNQADIYQKWDVGGYKE